MGYYFQIRVSEEKIKMEKKGYSFKRFSKQNVVAVIAVSKVYVILSYSLIGFRILCQINVSQIGIDHQCEQG